MGRRPRLDEDEQVGDGEGQPEQGEGELAPVVDARAGALPTETANYVPAVLAASLFCTDPASFELAGRFESLIGRLRTAAGGSETGGASS